MRYDLHGRPSRRYEFAKHEKAMIGSTSIAFSVGAECTIPVEKPLLESSITLEFTSRTVTAVLEMTTSY